MITTAWALIALATTTGIAGLLRGFSGFGGALVMAPVFTLIDGATGSVALITIIHVLTCFQGVRSAVSLAPPRLIVPLILASILATPLGVLLLGTLDPRWTKRVIGTLVLAFAVGIRSGFVLPGGDRSSTAVGVGLVSGILNGFCGIGGPPAVLYLLGTGGPSASLRASFQLLFAALYPATALALALFGLLTWPSIVVAMLLSPIYVLATRAGERLFRSRHSRWFDPVCIGALCLSGSLILLSS